MVDNSISTLVSIYPLHKGEFLPAYVSRLLKFAHFITATDLFKHFGVGVPRTADGFLPLWAIKIAHSNVLGKKLNDVVDEHMGGSFWRPFIDEKGFNNFISNQVERKGTERVLFTGEKTLTKYAPLKYCERCRDENMTRRSYAIWMSHHQLPTVFTCQKHGDVLHQKHLRSQPVPDGKSHQSFEQTGGIQPKILMFHRWLEFETTLIMASNHVCSAESLAMHRRVFLESSFYQAKNTKVDKKLSAQWTRALPRYLTILFPEYKDELWKQLQPNNFGLNAMMDSSKPVHPLLLLLFKTFYMHEFEA